MASLWEAEKSTTTRWKPVDNDTQQAITSAGSEEFDRLGLTDDMLAEFKSCEATQTDDKRGRYVAV